MPDSVMPGTAASRAIDQPPVQEQERLLDRAREVGRRRRLLVDAEEEVEGALNLQLELLHVGQPGLLQRVLQVRRRRERVVQLLAAQRAHAMVHEELLVAVAGPPRRPPPADTRA